MQCEDVRNRLTDYLTDQLEASDTGALLQHLSSCPGCKTEGDELEALWIEMGSVSDAPVDAKRMARRFGKVLDTYTHGVTTTIPRQRRRTAYALALMATLAVGLLVAQRNGLFAPSAPTTAQAPPEPVAPAAQTQATAVTPAPEISTFTPTTGTTPGQPIATIAEQVAAAQNTDAGARRLQFAAASVRPGRPPREQAVTPIRCKGVDGELETGFGPTNATDPDSPPQGRCTGNNVPLIALLATTYGIIYGERIIGVPDIGAPQHPTYQIQAVAEDPSRTTKADLQQMLQNLLTGRFKAKVHRETREGDGFVLTVAKSGIRFNLTSGDEERPVLRSPQGGRPTPPGPGGGSIPLVVKGRYRMTEFASFLRELLGDAPVADKTNLSGLYDITLTFDLNPSTGQRGQSRGGLNTSPPVPRALEDQLGLHLEPGRIPVEFLIVDHIEKPSEN